jgi:hypothetical protein
MTPPSIADVLSRAAEWQPIETAPKDGANVVVYARRGSNGTIRRTRRGCMASVAHFEAGWGWLSSPGDYQLYPTHWMPLPAPPACPGHIASDGDPKVCRHCGTHVDEERP